MGSSIAKKKKQIEKNSLFVQKPNVTISRKPKIQSYPIHTIRFIFIASIDSKIDLISDICENFPSIRRYNESIASYRWTLKHHLSQQPNKMVNGKSCDSCDAMMLMVGHTHLCYVFGCMFSSN